MLVFGGDSVAYFVGKQFGKSTLASKLSPKKTIAGAWGAIAASLLVTLIWVQWIYPGHFDRHQLLWLYLFAPIASVVAQLGDLLESLIKRAEGVKDSGAFLPGHGGMLDRVDGLALISPVFYGFVANVLS